MISLGMANVVILTSLALSIGAYIFVSRHEGTYVNILTPALVVNVPASYLLPLVYNQLFGTEASQFLLTFMFI